MAVVTEVRERFESTDAALLTEYRGIDVSSMQELRRALHEAGGDYKIYKNTLVRIAIDGLDLQIDSRVGPALSEATTEIMGLDDGRHGGGFCNPHSLL